MNNSIFNETTSMIIREGSKTEKCDSYECGESCADFEDTMKDLDKTKMTYTIDSLPILKGECGEGCGKEGCCKESYMIEHDILTKYMTSYDIDDEVEAMHNIAEHYGLDISDLVLVVEGDYVAKGLLKKAKCDNDCGIINSLCAAIKNCKNHGIRVAKKS